LHLDSTQSFAHHEHVEAPRRGDVEHTCSRTPLRFTHSARVPRPERGHDKDLT
jgi:hypothetical protein